MEIALNDFHAERCPLSRHAAGVVRYERRVTKQGKYYKVYNTIDVIFEKYLSERKDLSNISFRRLGITREKVRKDKDSDFLISGENSDDVIGVLSRLEGISITDLERELRPDPNIESGMLGPHESLVSLLVEDNHRVTQELHLTHRKLAEPLYIVRKALSGLGKANIVLGGQEFHVEIWEHTVSAAFAAFPNISGAKIFYVKNLDTGMELYFASMLPDLIDRYGFYEGKADNVGTFRLVPKQIVDVFGYLKNGRQNPPN